MAIADSLATLLHRRPTANMLERLRSEAVGLFDRARSDTLMPDDLTATASVRRNGIHRAAADALAKPRLHEPDFAIFGAFRRGDGTILDVGANAGYSVESIRAAGSDCPVLSFEVLPEFEPHLEAMREVMSKDFDYVICGLGAGPATLEFMTPVVSGLALTALTTARWKDFEQHHIDGLIGNLLGFARDQMKAGRLLPQLAMTTARVDTLDTILAGYHGTLSIDSIAAIKIDVEGLEAEVLEGALETLGRHHPLIMLEGGNRWPRVGDITTALGYLHGELIAGRLVEAEGYSRGANGFFMHRNRLEEYRGKGLIA